MAKNIQIFFVYDASKADASDSILYFYPDWVSGDQKGALCGQIVGTIQCARTLFARPDVITMQNGKFLVIETDNLYFVMGTDRNASDSFLRSVTENLHSLLKFFHVDAETLQTPSRDNPALKKLHDIFEGYLKTLNHHSANPFPQHPFSKSLNDIFIEAMQILECCKTIEFVLGGAIIHRNRVIATQLNTLLTQLLLLSATCNVQGPSITDQLPFNLSIDTQLYEVYISSGEYSNLLNDLKENDLFEHLHKGDLKKMAKKPIGKSSTTALLSAMQREQSLILTSVPEEGAATRPAGRKPRPRFLNLDNNAAPKKPPRPPAAVPPSASQLLVCNTPSQEQKKIVHFNPLLICTNECDKRKTSTAKNEFRSIEAVPFDRKSARYKTIADPLYPLFKPDGRLMSLHLHRTNRVPNTVPKCYEETAGRVDGVPNKGLLPSRSFFNCKFKAGKDNKNRQAMLGKPNFEFRCKKSSRISSTERDSNGTRRCLLFVWEHEDTVLTVLIRKEAGELKDVIESLGDVCARHASKLECKIRNKSHSRNVQQEKDANKFLVMDGTSARFRSIGSSDDEWRHLNHFRGDFDGSNVREVFVRCDETVLYGYSCGPMRAFYSETSSCQGGLPLPTDPLGVLQIKAKRRLEKDCAFVLL
ncbi:unnamed protein product [Phyllotreta striolata]|uniref:CCZ1/INTU/HSP4 first Longin domain-containing protein n=1 Tax=Phyllotreta striolata TaxID=444603 RepID=A0A9P0DMF4_PHYSR|nr:unnamed protein product [Phyllotreta striolata]